MALIIDMKGTPQGKDAIPTKELEKLLSLLYRLDVIGIVHLYDVADDGSHMMDAMRYLLNV